jgi:hypothetical protein
MHLLFTLLLIALLACVPTLKAWGLDVNIGQETYSLNYTTDQLSARRGAIALKGQKLAEDEAFSQWRFQPKDEPAFEIIYNNLSNTTITIKSNANDAGGPFFIAAKDKYLLLEYGTGSDPTPFALVDDRGTRLYADTYWSRFPIGYQVANATLYLEYVGSSDVSDPEQQKHCHDTTGGEPRQLDTRLVNLKHSSDVNIDHLNYYVCTY